MTPQRISKDRAEFTPEFEFLKGTARDLWLWLESRRLGMTFGRARDYSLDTGNKCPEKRGWKNRLINARAFGKRGLFSSRYPRERLLNTLPLLLWERETLTDPELRQRVCGELRVSTTADFPAMVRAYETIWRKFN